MDIKQIVNSKGVKGAVAVSNGADFHLLHSMSQGSNMPMSETGSERGNSPHDSEHSRYSAPRYSQINSMNGGHNSMRYPSPTAMQSPLPMMQQSYRPDNTFDNNMLQPDNAQRARQSGDTVAQKAFPCSTCGKGFARRSDLARHGQ